MSRFYWIHWLGFNISVCYYCYYYCYYNCLSLISNLYVASTVIEFRVDFESKQIHSPLIMTPFQAPVSHRIQDFGEVLTFIGQCVMDNNWRH